MFSLIKFLFCTVVFGAIAVFLLSMPLGEKTLWEHLVGISKTDEATDLKVEIGKKVDETTVKIKERASDLAKDKLIKSDTPSSSQDKQKNSKGVSKEERQKLKALIQAKSTTDVRLEDRAALGNLIRQKRQEN